jgi:hypothetical protein
MANERRSSAGGKRKCSDKTLTRRAVNKLQPMSLQLRPMSLRAGQAGDGAAPEEHVTQALKEPAIDEDERCGESPVQRLLLGETELPKYDSCNPQFIPLAEALTARPMTETEIECFVERMEYFRSPLISQLVSKKLLACNTRRYVQVGSVLVR